MFINIPKDMTPEELYRWAVELCEILNRSNNEKEKETRDGV